MEKDSQYPNENQNSQGAILAECSINAESDGCVLVGKQYDVNAGIKFDPDQILEETSLKPPYLIEYHFLIHSENNCIKIVNGKRPEGYHRLMVANANNPDLQSRIFKIEIVEEGVGKVVIDCFHKRNYLKSIVFVLQCKNK